MEETTCLKVARTSPEASHGVGIFCRCLVAGKPPHMNGSTLLTKQEVPTFLLGLLQRPFRVRCAMPFLLVVIFQEVFLARGGVVGPVLCAGRSDRGDTCSRQKRIDDLVSQGYLGLPSRSE